MMDGFVEPDGCHLHFNKSLAFFAFQPVLAYVRHSRWLDNMLGKIKVKSDNGETRISVHAGIQIAVGTNIKIVSFSNKNLVHCGGM